MAATPQAKIAVHTPSTPLHGARYDTTPRHAYATRKNTRGTSFAKRLAETPPPQSITQKSQSASKKARNRPAPGSVQSPPSSTRTSPYRVSKSKNLSKGNRGGAMDEHMSRDPLLDPSAQPPQDPLLRPTADVGASMLPTPVKTPRKKQAQQGAFKGAGRVLFPDRLDDAMPRKNRKGRKQVDFSLYGSMEDDAEGTQNDITVYTDSKDKVPEYDPSTDNPFLEKPKDHSPPPEPTKKSTSRKRKATHGMDGSKEIEEAFNRDEGMVYVFRGKKIYRKFPEEGDDDESGDEADQAVNGGAKSEVPRTRPLRRSEIKPRLLFPGGSNARGAGRSKSDIEDEEATTDVDDAHRHEQSSTAEEQEAGAAAAHTPVKDKFLPSTPPDTARATRTTRRGVEAPVMAADASLAASTPQTAADEIAETEDGSAAAGGPRGKKISPFDGWARTKAGVGAASGTTRSGGGGGDKDKSKGKKRAAAEAMDVGDEEDDGTSKRLRQGTV